MLNHCQQRRQQGDRCNHHEQHANDGTDCKAASKRKAHEEEPEERNDHGDSCKNDCSSRGIYGVDNCVFNAETIFQAFSISSDDKQRVVDAHTEANHCNE